jgi:VIT1/CCC1 family predicted Fe2+/Mn2+ transporter
MRSYAFLITSAIMVTAFLGIVFASVTLTSTKDAKPMQQASLVVK